MIEHTTDFVEPDALLLTIDNGAPHRDAHSRSGRLIAPR